MENIENKKTIENSNQDEKKKKFGFDGKTIGIAIVAAIAILAGYVVIARGQMKKQSLATDSKFAGVEEVYKERMDLLDKFMASAEPLMQEKEKYFKNFSKYKKEYKNAEIIDDRVRYINKAEGEAQKAIAYIGDYPAVRDNQEVANLLNKLQGDESFSEPKKEFNDAVGFYNIMIHRIRYRLATAVLGNEPKTNLKTISELKKAAEKNREKALEEKAVE